MAIWFRPKQDRNGDDWAKTAPGERIYAIGDVHGCYDLLRTLRDRIELHHRALPSPKRLRLVVLGDVIDRGPASARVLNLLRRVSKVNDALVVLMGNHEAMMLDALAGGAREQRF